MTSITVRATEDVGIGKKEAERAKNMFALGSGVVDVRAADRRPRSTGSSGSSAASRRSRCERRRVQGRVQLRRDHRAVRSFVQGEAAPVEPGTYRNIAGSTALSWGLVAAAQRSGLTLFYASYPITPASELLHELSRHKNFGVITLQAEDEIAAANMALGASFAGQLAVTGTSGPGMDLKAETLGLAAIMELPMIIVDVQRGGPSTGLPTKTEQSDLLLAMFGRHGESPMPILAASTPADCFDGGDRSGAHRRRVSHAGDPAIRHVPVELIGAVADPGRRVPALRSSRVRGAPRTATGSCRTSATRSWPARGPCRGRRAWCTGSAGSSARTGPATSATSPRTTSG